MSQAHCSHNWKTNAHRKHIYKIRKNYQNMMKPRVPNAGAIYRIILFMGLKLRFALHSFCTQ